MPVIEESRARIPAEAVNLDGDLRVPDAAARLILLVNADNDPILRSVQHDIANALQVRGFATLHVELVTAAEAGVDQHDGRFHLDTRFLSDRMCAILGWIREQPAWRSRPVGVVVTGNAAAGVLTSAAHHADQVAAIVSIEGRADLSADSLNRVRARTLLLAAELDTHLADLNRYAAAHLPDARLDILKGATYRLDDSRTRADVIHRTTDWFGKAFLAEPPHANM